jgi:SAM-dependent methyltransferase
MSAEKYMIDIGKEGSVGLGRLDYCYNQTTQEFLRKAGLKQGMTVLDIGCGSGVMTCWLAEQVGAEGRVIGIENNMNQLNAAKRNAEKQSIQNAEFKFCSAYELETLKQNFDLVFCRFVLHHLHQPMDVINKIFQSLKPGGVFASEEGIVNFSFSYPFSPAWGDEALRVPPVWVDAKADERDGNIGIKMFHKMRSAGFKIISTQIIHPLLTTRQEKSLLLLGREEEKQYFLDQGHTENEWEAMTKEVEKIIENDLQIIGFYASCQVAGVKA